jgi:hypothetical protein
MVLLPTAVRGPARTPRETPLFFGFSETVVLKFEFSDSFIVIFAEF